MMETEIEKANRLIKAFQNMIIDAAAQFSLDIARYEETIKKLKKIKAKLDGGNDG